ncbi:gamma-butyrobetaine dioxygenase [Fistulifera solaris]|jgi:gamma-butyrobetaine dioxygenase|uniref:Gamma-butyrobetaine dioxygenase n=1 Tax=Fistulifera solaris TaxID=1519565 RepID=A0A1Z5KEI8_FISSO|nr:gamma-butyrobetaine dioxygenase [Fistulifera solaris]|eukprot:GAX24740.1 gamma-butyrobetaine dioxygenase [Fistulifera solaris]
MDTPTSDSDAPKWILQVHWEGPQPLHTAYYDIGWLQQCHTMSLHDNDKSSIHANKTIVTQQTQLLSFDHDKVLRHDDNLFRLLRSLLEYGAVLIENTPNTDTACANIGKRLSGGTLSHGSLYGDVFDVQSIPNAHNIAYTNDALAVHQDLAYYESPPGFQLLHCRTNTVTDGGASLLIDALAAAETLANLAPDLFATLTRVPATFLKQRSGADMMYRRTHIRVSEHNRTEVLSVHWAPPFEGPLFSSSEEDTREYFVARAAFERMLDVLLPRQERYLPMLDRQLEQQLIDYAHNYTWQQTLQPKQILVFSNQRLLHGRTAFRIDTANGGTRHLTGCYTNVDETLQQYRLLRRQRLRGAQDLEALPVMGHGSHRIS